MDPSVVEAEQFAAASQPKFPGVSDPDELAEHGPVSWCSSIWVSHGASVDGLDPLSDPGAKLP
jgi:hypothetical protein